MSEKRTEINRRIQDLTDEIRVQRMFLQTHSSVVSDLSEWEGKVRSAVGVAAFSSDIFLAGRSLLRNTREEIPFLQRYSETLQAADKLFPLAVPLIEVLAERRVENAD